jgi:hypothetical protein
MGKINQSIATVAVGLTLLAASLAILTGLTVHGGGMMDLGSVSCAAHCLSEAHGTDSMPVAIPVFLIFGVVLVTMVIAAVAENTVFFRRFAYARPSPPLVDLLASYRE